MCPVRGLPAGNAPGGAVRCLPLSVECVSSVLRHWLDAEPAPGLGAPLQGWSQAHGGCEQLAGATRLGELVNYTAAARWRWFESAAGHLSLFRLRLDLVLLRCFVSNYLAVKRVLTAVWALALFWTVARSVCESVGLLVAADSTAAN